MFKWKDRNRRAAGAGNGYAPSASQADFQRSTKSPEVSPRRRLPSEAFPVREPDLSDSWSVDRDTNDPVSLPEDTFQELLSSGKLKENILRLRQGDSPSLYGNEPAPSKENGKSAFTCHKAAPECELKSEKSDYARPYYVTKKFQWARTTQAPSRLPEDKSQDYQAAQGPSLLPERKLQDYYESEGKHCDLNSENVEAKDFITTQSWNGPGNRTTQASSRLPEDKSQGYQTTQAPSLLPEHKLQDYYESEGKHCNLSSANTEATDFITTPSWKDPVDDQAPLARPGYRSQERRSKSRSKSRTRNLSSSYKIDETHADIEKNESASTRVPSMQPRQKSPVRTRGKMLKLSDAIRQACPSWSDKTVAAAEEKLVLVNVCCVAELVDALALCGKSSLNNQLLAAGLKAFSQDTLVALRKSLKVEVEDPKSLLDHDLLEVLYNTFPQWSAQAQAAVQEKLALVGATSISELAGMLTKNELNKQLLDAGQKVFTEETLALLRQAVLGVDQDLRDELSAQFPNWSAKAMQAVEEKLVLVGASSITGLRRLLACRGKYGLNWKLQEVGRGIFTDKTLKTMRQAFAVPDVPELPVDAEVHQVLCAACPSWSDLALEAAEEKLANVGATSVSELTRLLYGNAQDGLNAKLQEAGLKTFSRETLIELRTTLGIIDKALHVFLRDTCPSWSAVELEAAEHKLALVGVRDTHALSASIAATGSNSLNSKLVHAGLITFKRATLCIWCAALKIDIALPDSEE